MSHGMVVTLFPPPLGSAVIMALNIPGYGISHVLSFRDLSRELLAQRNKLKMWGRGLQGGGRVMASCSILLLESLP